MKFLDAFILLLLFVILGLGAYVAWSDFPFGASTYKEYELEAPVSEVLTFTQFYPNMRYRDTSISYSISNSCSISQRIEAERAFSILSEKTILEFYRVNKDAEISLLCSDIYPEPEEEGHFVAGEGGPSDIINTSKYSVIFSGKVSLYRNDECEKPNVALHEILHALGFDHNNNPRSIMYPITKCDQEIDDYIIEEINRLYRVESAPDLVIERITANKTGRYLNFESTVSNLGLKDSDSSILAIYVEGELIEIFDLESVGIGTRKILSVKNLKVPRESEIIVFAIETPESEITKKNNIAEVKLIEVD